MNVDFKSYKKGNYYLIIFTCEPWKIVKSAIFLKSGSSFKLLEEKNINSNFEDYKKRINDDIIREQINKLKNYPLLKPKEIENIENGKVPQGLISKVIKIIDKYNKWIIMRRN